MRLQYGEKMMKRVPTALLIATSLVLAAASATMASERTPPGSFLNYRATSVEQLMGEVAKNAAVRVRFARHFGVSPDELSKYFAENLDLVSLKSPLRTKTWFVGKGGRIYSKTKLYPKGTLVFTTKDGKPLLAWSCGNPLSANLPLKVETVPIAAAETTIVKPAVETVAATAVTAAPAPAVAALTPIMSPPPIGNFSVPPVAVPPSLGDKFGFGWLLPLVGLFRNTPTPNPVPEPSTLMAMGMGLSMVPVLRRVRRSRPHR